MLISHIKGSFDFGMFDFDFCSIFEFSENTLYALRAWLLAGELGSREEGRSQDNIY